MPRALGNELTYSLWKHVKGKGIELEGYFSSCVAIDDYMDWPRRTAKSLLDNQEVSAAGYSIVNESADDIESFQEEQ